MSGIFGGGGGGSSKPAVIPKVQAKRTAPPVAGQMSEAARKSRNRAAALRPRGFAPPTLGQPGLLGGSRQ